ncbi:MAG TPA: HAMP domain-containing sensor histidine kinase [Gaiellaceae bacterium]|nr:HAMP domain-containing sensor histidine kinase [Gaiellaceae bacterium]
MSIRLRAVLAAAAATLLALVALGAVVDVLVARHLTTALDHALRQRAVEVAQIAASTPNLLQDRGALDAPAGDASAMVEVVDRNGRIVARSASLGSRELATSLAGDAIAGRSGYRRGTLGTTTLRVYAAPLAAGAGAAAGGAVVVAASTDGVEDTVRETHLVTLVGAVGAALLGAGLVWFLLGRAVAPLARLDRAAAEIGRTADPSRRLPEAQRDDEVGRLASTLNRMLESLDRAQSRERRFVADASHELRTPLTSLRGNVDHLARHGATPSLVADLQTDAARLVRLADDLLALSREEAGRPTSGDEIAANELARAAGADTWTAEQLSVHGDRDALVRAVGNLVENARRHGRGRVTLAIAKRGGRARISVSDEGDGVAVADRERVFERFHGDGSGLGLSIVRATAERHGGAAYVDGSTFTIELPVMKSSESADTTSGEKLEKGSL